MSIRRLSKDPADPDPVQASDVEGYMDHNTIAHRKAAVTGRRKPFYAAYDSRGLFKKTV